MDTHRQPEPAKKAWPRNARLALVLLLALSGLYIAIPAIADMRSPEGDFHKTFAGVFIFLLAPGAAVKLLVLPDRRLSLFEWLPVSIVFSMAVWAAPGLLAYVFRAPLGTLAAGQLLLVQALCILALFFSLKSGETESMERPPIGARALLIAAGLLTVAVSWYFGAFRGSVLDWDYYNYISHIRKLVAWEHASIAHFAYKDAPPDPIHSYNIWALQWAQMAKLFLIDPISLYRRAAVVTIPAAIFAFYGLSRRAIGDVPARTALILYFAYQVVYGGLIFVGRTTFYPADSQWLVVFPTCLMLFTFLLEEKGPSRKKSFYAALGLSVLALSVTHVLWGLCFYLSVLAYAAYIVGERTNLREFLCRVLGVGRGGGKTGGGRWPAVAAIALLIFPLAVSLFGSMIMAARDTTDGRAPLWMFDGGGLRGQLAVLFLIFMAAPILALWWTRKNEAAGNKGDYSAGNLFSKLGASRELRIAAAVIGLCLLIALPYALLRYQAIQNTAWGQFGRNPYRALVTAWIFFLNPFKLTLLNPNMTFYPLYLLSYLCLPLVFKRLSLTGAGKMTVAVLVAVPLICFHPALATLFAKFFSLGYLRRLLRLAALFSFIPFSLGFHLLLSKIMDPERRPLLFGGLAGAAAVALSWLFIFFPADEAYYNQMLLRQFEIAKAHPYDSLILPHPPYQIIEQKNLFGRDEVIFADIFTSYRLTAFAPVYVAVQQKPGTGVADQDDRRILEMEFFEASTPVSRMREILDRFGATGVILNRSPFYKLYGLPMSHPEVIGKLKSDPDHFELLVERKIWVIFRYHPSPEADGGQPPPTPQQSGD